jgi:hypothetical protein
MSTGKDRNRTYPGSNLKTRKDIAKNIGKGDLALYTLKTEIANVNFRSIVPEKHVRAAD